MVAAQRRSRVRALVWRSCASLASSRSVAMAAERERVRQMELESERLREVVETLEIRLRAARADHAKELAEARFEVSSANERARQARTRADALEEALAGGARPARELASSVGASPLSSPLHSPRGARPDDALASRPARRGVADAVADLVTWRAPGKSARVLGLGLYLQLCVSSLRSMPLPFWTVFCYGAIFSLAASLAWRIFRRFRRGLAPHARAVAADAVALADARRAREASVRRVAAKLGGWVASSAASRAPLAAESWIALERCVAWEHPPTTLKACATLWLVSLVARVWWLPASTTACVLWVGAFVVPPALVAAAPTAGATARTALDELVSRFAHVLNDRRVQLAALGTIWSLTGYAGRTLLALAVATAFLTSGSNATRTDDGFGAGSTTRGGVVITELPESPTRDDRDAAAKAVWRSPERRNAIPRFGNDVGSDPPSPRFEESRRVASRHGRVARHADAIADARARERWRSSSSSESDGEDDLSPPSPLRRSRLKSGATSAKSSPTRRGTGTRGRLEEATSARQRMIAERARRLLDDD